MRRAPLATALALATLAAPLAHASPEEDKAVARKEFDAGVDADRRRDWAGALDHYLRANDLVEHPFTIFNIAADYEHLGKLREAAEWYRRYLDKATDPSDLAKVRQTLADLEARPGPLTIRSVPGGARAFVDGAPVGVTPLTLPVKGGSHRIAVEHEGQRAERDVRLTYGEAQDINVPIGQQPATLLVIGSPAGATIYVDGQPSGTLPSAQVPVTEGAHEIRVIAPGYAPYTVTSDATANGVTKVPITLQSASGAGAGGVFIGYYLALGGGADAGGRGAVERVELGVNASHYDFGMMFGKLGDDSQFALGGRYYIGSARVAPFVGAEYVFTPGAGIGATAGLRIDLLRTPTMAIAGFAWAGAYRFTTTVTDASGASTTGAVTAFPIGVTLYGAFGRHLPTSGTTPSATAPGVP